MAYKQQKFITQRFGGWEVQVKVLADLLSGGAFFLVHRQLSFHCILTLEGLRELCRISSMGH